MPHRLITVIILLPIAQALAVDDSSPPGAASPAAPRRIITIAPNAAEIIAALGEGDRIVGVDKFCVYPPALLDKPKVGGLFDPDLEKIIALRPDLVVLRGRCESVESLCRQRGIRLYLDQTDTLADIETAIRDLGRLLGRQKEAEQLAASFRDRLKAIRTAAADKPKPRVFLSVSRRPDRLADVLTAAQGSFLDEMLDIAGAKNIFGHLQMAYPQVSAESILARRPDVIIELMPEQRVDEEAAARMIEQWRSLGPIPAAKNGRIHFITDENALIPSLRYVEIIEKVSAILHPPDQSTNPPDSAEPSRER